MEGSSRCVNETRRRMYYGHIGLYMSMTRLVLLLTLSLEPWIPNEMIPERFVSIQNTFAVQTLNLYTSIESDSLHSLHISSKLCSDYLPDGTILLSW